MPWAFVKNYVEVAIIACVNVMDVFQHLSVRDLEERHLLFKYTFLFQV